MIKESTIKIVGENFETNAAIVCAQIIRERIQFATLINETEEEAVVTLTGGY